MRWLILLCLPVLTGCIAESFADEEAELTVEVAKEISLFESVGGKPAPKPDKVPRSKCTVCNGTGKVLSGDGLSRVNCSNCYDDGSGFVPPKKEHKTSVKLPLKPDPPKEPQKPAATVATESSYERTGPVRRARGFLRRLFRCRR